MLLAYPRSSQASLSVIPTWKSERLRKGYCEPVNKTWLSRFSTVHVGLEDAAKLPCGADFCVAHVCVPHKQLGRTVQIREV